MSEISRPQLPHSAGNLIATQVHFSPIENIMDAMASLRAAFGFSTKVLANALRIEQRTLADWISGKSEPNNENIFRIRSLEYLAEKWNNLCRLPAKKVLQISLEHKTTLLNELCQENLDYNKIISTMELAAEWINTYELPKYTHKETPKKSNRFSEYDLINLHAYLVEDIE
jgi:transcriptional regulator with XRE-family HTH domain